MQGHLEALKLSIKIARFAILERYIELKNDKTPIHYSKVSEKFDNDSKGFMTDYFSNIENLKTVSDRYWEVYMKATDERILSIKP